MTSEDRKRIWTDRISGDNVGSTVVERVDLELRDGQGGTTLLYTVLKGAPKPEVLAAVATQ